MVEMGGGCGAWDPSVRCRRRKLKNGQRKVNPSLLFGKAELISFATGDRVQWFRAEADMQRWQEQVEVKLAEFLRHGRSCAKMTAIWTELSKSQPENLPGHVAYAKQRAAMYARMQKECEDSFDNAGYKDLRLRIARGEQSLVQYVAAKRAEAFTFVRTGDLETGM
jgi:hypothetical protein